MENPNTTSVSKVMLAWDRIGPWLPWMKMGDRSGNLIYSAWGGAKPQTVALKFDGKVYPSNPSLQPPITGENTVEGVKVFPIVE